MLMPAVKPLGDLENPSEFVARHIGLSEADEAHMRSVIGESSRRADVAALVAIVVPGDGRGPEDAQHFGPLRAELFGVLDRELVGTR